jgi:putative FmdB family regulatory protein
MYIRFTTLRPRALAWGGGGTLRRVTLTLQPEIDMPIYEYRCQGCGHQFELLVLKSTTVACPACSGAELERLLSLPAIKSETTHALAMDAAKLRDKKQAADINRAQREYELHHND